MPGDRVYVPDKAVGEASAAAGARHRFKLKVAVPKLRLLLTGFDAKPLPNTACKLTFGGTAHDVTTNASGVLEYSLPPGTEDGTLTIAEREIAFKIGHLDPIDQRSGLLERLRNLGYLEPLAEGEADSEVANDDVAFAVSCFQRDFGLSVDGDSQAIIDKLKDVYGC